MKHFKWVAGITACSLCLTNMFLWRNSVPVQADDGKKVVVIGDGISSGAGLAEGEKSYVDWLEYYTDVQIQNFAQDNYTTDDILQCLDDTQVQTALSEADIILVTAGLVDIMSPFLEVANSYMEEFHFVHFTDVFTASLEEHGVESEDELIPYSNELGRAVRSNQETATANLLLIVEKLSQYQNAEIIYQTVYNSTDTIENLSSLSMKRRVAYNSVCNPITAVVNESFNDYLNTLDGEGNCLVVDTFNGFKGYAYQYTNLNDLDANPNAEGHVWIANAVIEKAGLEKTEPTEPPTEEPTETTETTTTQTSTSTSTSASTTTSTTQTSTSTSTSASTTTSTTETSTSTSTSTSTTTSTTETSTSTSTSTTASTTETSTSTSTTPVSETTELGDLNGDGNITAADASVLLVAIANIGSGNESGLSPETEETADFNHDGKLTSSDAALILVYAAGRGNGQIDVSFAEYLENQ